VFSLEFPKMKSFLEPITPKVFPPPYGAFFFCFLLIFSYPLCNFNAYLSPNDHFFLSVIFSLMLSFSLILPSFPSRNSFLQALDPKDAQRDLFSNIGWTCTPL